MVCFMIAIGKSVVWLLCSQQNSCITQVLNNFPLCYIELISQHPPQNTIWLVTWLVVDFEKCSSAIVLDKLSEFTRKTIWLWLATTHHQSAACSYSHELIELSIIFWLLFAYFFMNEHCTLLTLNGNGKKVIQNRNWASVVFQKSWSQFIKMSHKLVWARGQDKLDICA